MPDEQPQDTPANQPKPEPVSPPPAGRVPMSEEFDRAKWTLPPPKAIAIGLAVFAVLAAILFYVTRATPVVSGSIDHIAVASPVEDQVLVGINVSFTNVLEEEPVWLHSASARLTRPEGEELTDTATTIVNFERYFQAFPELQQNAIEPLRPDTKLMPGESVSGMIIVSFPVSREEFERRQQLTAVLNFYDQLPVVIADRE